MRPFSIVVLIAALVSGCEITPRQVSMQLAFFEADGAPMASDNTFYVREARGSIHTSFYQIGIINTCDEGRVDLSGSFRFPIHLTGPGVWRVINEDEIDSGKPIYIVREDWLSSDRDDNPVLNDCPERHSG